MAKTNFSNGKKGQMYNGNKSNNKINPKSENKEIVKRAILKYLVSALSTVTIKAAFDDAQKKDINETCPTYRYGDATDALVELHKEF